MNKLPQLNKNEKLISLANLWLKSKYNKNTIDTYKIQFQKIIQDIDIFNLTTSMLQKYIDDCISHNEAKASIFLRIATIKSFLSFCIRTANNENDKIRLKSLYNHLRDIDKTPLKENNHNNVMKIKRRVISKEKIEYLLRNVKNPTTKLLIFLLSNTGTRISELINLRFYDKDKDDESYTNFIRWEGNRFYVCLCGKGGRIREFYINSKVSIKLKKMRKVMPSEYVVVNKKGKRLTRFGAYKLLKNVQRKYLSEMNYFKFGNHCFRHSYITFQKEANVDSGIISKVVGNSAAIIERTYNHAIPEINENIAIGV